MFTFIRFFLLLLTDRHPRFYNDELLLNVAKKVQKQVKVLIYFSDTTQWIQADAAKATDRTFQRPRFTVERIVNKL
jgi:hypothetical protein